MTLGSRLTHLLGIEYPIIQGGMAWTATAELAVAVSEAGGLGIIGAGSMPADVLADEVEKAQAGTTRPYGVNIMLMADNVDDLMQVVTDAKVPVITTGAGNPATYMESLKGAGCRVLPIAPTTALAKRLEKVGADAIIGEGMEAGGHIGDLTTFVLTPQLVDAVDVPVIAAGGIADGRGMAAAFALGAAGVQVGTRFMCAAECEIHDDVKQRIISAKDRDAVISGHSTGHPVRALKNKLTRRIQELDKTGDTDAIVEAGTGKLAAAMRDGDIETGSIMAGQAAAMVDQIAPAAQIIDEMMAEAEETLSSLNASLS
jgi:enoyl-[acyl-carrier protein] reductase II